MTEGGVEWEEFEIENIVNNEERTVVVHAAAGVIRHENGYKEDNDKKKKKKSVITFFPKLKEVVMWFLANWNIFKTWSTWIRKTH